MEKKPDGLSILFGHFTDYVQVMEKFDRFCGTREFRASGGLKR